jgi:hypothetical protein
VKSQCSHVIPLFEILERFQAFIARMGTLLDLSFSSLISGILMPHNPPYGAGSFENRLLEGHVFSPMLE